METMQAIKSRRSIRDYTGQPITEEELAAILEAAQAAPVGMGAYENVHLTVVKDLDLLSRINKTAQAAFSGNTNPLYGAPTLIVVSVKLQEGMTNNVAYSNAAILVENMALAATDLGVGCCHIWGAIMVVDQNPALIADLKVPEGYTPACAIALGKTRETYGVREIPKDRITVNVLE